MKQFENIVSYYQEEIASLRHMAKDFAKEYPIIANRIGLNESYGEDPHVRRLIESFAFLTAKLHARIDDHFPEVIDLMTNTFYPDFLAPIPAMTTISLKPRPRFNKKQVLPAQSRIKFGNEDLFFSTCFPTPILPVELQQIEFFQAPFAGGHSAHGAKSMLQMRLSSGPSGTSFDKIEGLDQLRFFFSGDESQAIDWMFHCNKHLVDVAVEANGKRSFLGKKAFQQLGFDDTYNVAPYSNGHVPAYRLLWEFFQFPQKFLYFSIQGFESLDLADDESMELSLYFDSDLENIGPFVDQETLTINCTPAINLFEEEIEPVKVKKQWQDIRLRVSANRNVKREIHHVSYLKAEIGGGRSRNLYPFFQPKALNYSEAIDGYWLTRRVAPDQHLTRGSEILVSFVDRELNICDFASSGYLRGRVFSTNREQTIHLAQRLPNMKLSIYGNKEVSIDHAHVVSSVTKPIWPNLGKENLWRLLSVLQIEDLTSSDGVTSLQSVCAAYNFGEEALHRGLWQSIEGISMHQSVAPVIVDGHAVLATGLEGVLEVDPSGLHGRMFLLAQVLDQMLSRLLPFNSFLRFGLKSTASKDVFAQFPARTSHGDIL